jgi:hypothetical protein
MGHDIVYYCGFLSLIWGRVQPPFLTTKVGVAGPYETSVTTYKTTRCRSRGYHNLSFYQRLPQSKHLSEDTTN